MNDAPITPPSPAANQEDTSTWLPLDGLEPGFDEYKQTPTDALSGTVLEAAFTDGSVLRYDFIDADAVQWSSGDQQHTDTYEAQLVDDGLYLVNIHHQHDPAVATAVIFDVEGGHVLHVASFVGPLDQRPTVITQEFRVGTLAGVQPVGDPPAPSTDLIGRRMLWEYSKVHAYEHVYVSPQWYTFQCLAGPEAGLADTDASTYYKVRKGIYLFAWREKVIPCAAVTIADHREFRSHGALFGLNGDNSTTEHFTFGAYGRLLSNTVYPDRYDFR